MIETKNKLKELGKKLRDRGAEHQEVLRAQLIGRMQDQEVRTSYSVLKPLVFSGASIFAVIALVIFTQLDDERVVAYAPASVVSEDEFFAGEGTVTSDSYYPYVTGYAPSQNSDDNDIVDYEQEHGSMLETSVTINLLTREEDPLGTTESLFTSFGGHISSIYDYGMGQPTTITGFVPADSYFLFREQLRDLVKSDRFMMESINAQDLIPSAISIDEYIEDVKTQIEKTTNQTKKDQLETQLENLQESRESLDSRVEYVTVGITIEESSGVWGAGDQYELERAMYGFNDPGFLDQACLNVVIVIFWFVQALSVAFWILIPIGIWLLVRRKNRRALRVLD